MSQKVYFSTGAFKQSSIEVIDALGKEGVFDIELSAGISTPELINEIKSRSSDFNFQVHNYFPPPPSPFVFNLASANNEIRDRTLHSMQKAIELTSLLNADVYSFHSGFLVDPPINFLGGTWAGLQKQGYEQAMENFSKSVVILQNYASERGVSLLVENNVLNHGTKESSGDDVLLMASPDQISEVMDILPKDVLLLLDVAHLKVSCKTFDIDPLVAIRELNKFVGGYHLSDNDGTSDSGELVSVESWFWKELRKDVTFSTLEVKTTTWAESFEQVKLARSLWMGN